VRLGRRSNLLDAGAAGEGAGAGGGGWLGGGRAWAAKDLGCKGFVLLAVASCGIVPCWFCVLGFRVECAQLHTLVDHLFKVGGDFAAALGVGDHGVGGWITRSVRQNVELAGGWKIISNVNK
jgi:hypothetical protein